MFADQEARGAAFAAMHRSEPFIIPNPWDAGSARILQALGFRALATTSSGLAFSLGRLDGAATLPRVTAHVRALVAATALPISVDLESGYGAAAGDAARAITWAAEAGAVGGSLEDWTAAWGFYTLHDAAKRVAAARRAADSLGFPFVLTARAENHLRGNPDLDDTIARLQAYSAAGADVLYAPGLGSLAEIETICENVDKPVNVLAIPSVSAQEIFASGAQRVSVGGRLTWVAAQAFIAAASELQRGNLAPLDAQPPPSQWLSG